LSFASIADENFRENIVPVGTYLLHIFGVNCRIIFALRGNEKRHFHENPTLKDALVYVHMLTDSKRVFVEERISWWSAEEPEPENDKINNHFQKTKILN